MGIGRGGWLSGEGHGHGEMGVGSGKWRVASGMWEGASPRTKSSNIQQFIYVYAPQTIESVLESAFSLPPLFLRFSFAFPPLFLRLAFSSWPLQLVRGKMV